MLYVLVRGRNAQLAEQRFFDRLNHFELFNEEINHLVKMQRIVVICGDLAQPQLALSTADFKRLGREVSVIYHVGSYVNHVSGYQTMRASNVNGTTEILRLACMEEGPMTTVRVAIFPLCVCP